MEIKINWTEAKKTKIIELVEAFIIKHKVTCGESVIQRDGPTIEAPEVLSDIADIVGADILDEE